MEDGLNLFERGRKLDVLKNENNLKKIMYPKPIKSKNNNISKNNAIKSN